ncbi:cobyrinic acid ac-diamide synthase [Hylemonella gracilis ATCC 19624]|uniref:Cobyrinic acid ac-diamide synthase n=2 Tax=Hylemonella gracilis TaxID=80880 RepID=F3KRU2_9BURK|nr:cobyrinic acid ac-diamide synthase [Hylemonella gracilis ATCC 19624]
MSVLVLDADPQCNASAYLLEETQLEAILRDGEHKSLDSFYEPIRKGQGYPQELPTIVTSVRFGVDLIVGDPKLSIREDLLATDWAATRNGEPRGFQTTFAIKYLLSRLNNYDLVFIDMGPSLGALNRSVLLGADSFIMPLSVDIFSLMAIDNILKSFTSWKVSLTDAIRKHAETEGENFTIKDHPVGWELEFIGYVMQQYKAKVVSGERVPVAAFERIINEQTNELRQMCEFFNCDYESAKIGEVPTLSSVVPLSQQAHAPIFDLGAKDGIVGSQYTRVSEATHFFGNIAERFLRRISK